MKAYRLYTTADGGSAFEEGNITRQQHITSAYFFLAEDAPERMEYDWHPAPHRQYVLTLRGVLEFTVTDGSTFQLHPGDILVAADTIGTGHKWSRLSNESWMRTYIVLEEGAEDGFTPL
ncbi:hypothetical protein MKQ68_10205 [Chitinophaga horti]|uniref:Cupin domain-containing protein n=1 Tax=Chitinophaga horti TaxID=2920382 RepID=A0ABY6JAZ8_9BACT|nr:hypothetical protein [Chitinophaga horti]UYQ95471.1 hypothetical protein MKQ68_10205 [Chitinophaga horti]